MSSQRSEAQTAPAPDPENRALLFTDIVGSTRLKRRLGLKRYMELLQHHEQQFAAALEAVLSRREGKYGIINDNGDGYFASFPNAQTALRFALIFQKGMTGPVRHPTRVPPVTPPGSDSPATPADGPEPDRLEVRVGIDVGQVESLPNSATGRAKLVAPNADLASRVTSLARAGQILLTGKAHDDAQVHKEYEDAAHRRIATSFRKCGFYHLAGEENPVEVWEATYDGAKPFRPSGNEKAERVGRRRLRRTVKWGMLIVLVAWLTASAVATLKLKEVRAAVVAADKEARAAAVAADEARATLARVNKERAATADAASFVTERVHLVDDGDLSRDREHLAVDAHRRFGTMPVAEAFVRDAAAAKLSLTGHRDSAVEHAQRAFDLRRASLGGEDPLVTETAARLVALLDRCGRFPAAADAYRYLFEETPNLGPRQKIRTGIGYMRDLAYLGQLDQANEVSGQVLAMAKATQRSDRDAIQSLVARAEVLSDIAGSQNEKNQRWTSSMAEARALALEAAQLAGDPTPDNPEAVRARIAVTSVDVEQARLGDLQEKQIAEKAAARLEEDGRRILGDEHPYTLVAAAVHGYALTNMNSMNDAKAVNDRVWELSRRLWGDRHPFTTDALHDRGLARWKIQTSSDLEEAMKMLEQAWHESESQVGEGNPRTRRFYRDWQDCVHTDPR